MEVNPNYADDDKRPRYPARQLAIDTTIAEWRQHFEGYHRKKRISIERIDNGSYRYPAVNQRWHAYYAHRVNELRKQGEPDLADLMATEVHP